MEYAQIAIGAGVGVFGALFTAFCVGYWTGLQSGKREQARAREALGVSGSANMRVIK
jgi:hypothetical protein